jgi:hypothetical protein
MIFLLCAHDAGVVHIGLALEQQLTDRHDSYPSLFKLLHDQRQRLKKCPSELL